MSAPSYQQILERELFPQLRKGASAVTGTARLARRLRYRYGLWRRAAGAGVWRRPGIFSWREWLQNLWEESLLRGGRAGQFTLLPEHGSMLLWERAAAEDWDNGLRLEQQAELARRSWNLALDFGLNHEQLRAEVQGEDEERFADWVGVFENLRREKGWLEPTALPRVLARDAQEGALIAKGPLFFLGMEDAFTPPGKMLVTALQGAGLAVLPAPERPRATSVRQAAFASPEEELEAAAGWTGAGNSGLLLLDFAERAGEARRILLDRMQPAWQSRGYPLTAPLNSAEAQWLAHSGPPEMALAILNLLPGEFEFERLSRVLRGAYLHGCREEQGPRAQLERALRARLLGARLNRRQLIWLARDRAPMLAESLQQGWKLARKARGKERRQTHRTWGAVFTAFLDALGWPGKRPLESDEQQSLKAWRKLLSDFGGCDAVSAQGMSLEKALGRLEAMARRRSFQPQGPDEAVELLPMEEAAGMHFGRLWVAGASASLWPSRGVNPAPFLPLVLQRRLGIPRASPQAALVQARRQTDALVYAGEEVMLSWTRVAEEGVPTTLSPLAAALKPQDTEAAPEKSDAAKAEAELSYVKALQRSADLQLLESDDAPAVDGEEEVTGGTHLMDQQLNCPFRAFVEFRLHAREYPQPCDGLSPRDRGNIVHALLERLYQVCPDDDVLQAALDDLPQRLEEWSEDIPKHGPLGQRALVQEFLKLERGRAVRLALELTGKDKARRFRIESREEEAFLELGPLELAMRLDRVESMGQEGGCLVLDYKTGTRKVYLSHLNPANLRASQLPAYALATEGALGVGYVYLNEKGIEFSGVLDPELALEKGEAVAGVDPSADRIRGYETWPALIDAWRIALENAAGQLTGGDARVQMDRNDNRARGQYQILSRIHELEADEQIGKKRQTMSRAGEVEAADSMADANP